MHYCPAILSMYCPVINRVYNSQLNNIQEAMKHIWNNSCIKSTELSFWFYYFHSYFPRCSIKNSFFILFLCGKVQKAKSIILRSASPLAMICNTRRAQGKNQSRRCPESASVYTFKVRDIPTIYLSHCNGKIFLIKGPLKCIRLSKIQLLYILY